MDNCQTNSCNIGINATQTTIRLIQVIMVSIGQTTIIQFHVILGIKGTQTTIGLIYVIWVSILHRQLSD